MSKSKKKVPAVMSESKKKKPTVIRACRVCTEVLPLAKFVRNRGKPGGYEHICKPCQAVRSSKLRHGTEEAEFIRAQEERARRLESDIEPLKPEDFDDDDYDVSIANNNSATAKKISHQAAKEKRQEFNASMGRFTDDIKRAAASAPSRNGEMASQLSPESGTYMGKLAEQEQRYRNRRLARAISLAQASEAINLQQMKQIATEYFSNKITPIGYARKVPAKTAKRAICLLLSDLHIGAELEPFEEPYSFRALEEARRLEYIMRETIDYKPHYRNNTKLVLLWNGDLIEGKLGHDLHSGAPLAEQKAAFWSYSSAMMGHFAAAFPEVEVHFQSGNHGRDKVRHPGRATSRKWDGHEFELGFALQQMCSGLRNVTWHQPFRAVSIVDLFGRPLGLTHADTEVAIGHPDKAAEANSNTLRKINTTKQYGTQFAAWAFGHYHTGRYALGEISMVFNAALVPPSGYARGAGYIDEQCGQMLWEAVEGFPIGDLRFLRVDASTDRDESLGKIIKPFRFPREQHA